MKVTINDRPVGWDDFGVAAGAGVAAAGLVGLGWQAVAIAGGAAVAGFFLFLQRRKWVRSQTCSGGTPPGQP